MASAAAVSEIFLFAGAAFSRLAEQTTLALETAEDGSGRLKWTSAELQMLRDCVGRHGAGDLQRIAETLRTKSVHQIKAQIRRSQLAPPAKRQAGGGGGPAAKKAKVKAEVDAAVPVKHEVDAAEAPPLPTSPPPPLEAEAEPGDAAEDEVEDDEADDVSGDLEDEADIEGEDEQEDQVDDDEEEELAEAGILSSVGGDGASAAEAGLEADVDADLDELL